ncbi:SDR family NAD(P)-dependent oxidoreductase [candidate division WWE3 bacterium]|uniref:SDR family NAD(P)-dependent oxidoreductase n=1 Tax=candidate division WWE3 bacterium TaxID=2053526 RepID=A0A955LKI4_UNCKA|nr:SDR family NAD(P)-dependent oxidoreductase [candidate division WWE3 bacterium]
MKVKDKTIIVTGAGSGIGRAIVLELLSRGAIVAAVDINDASLQETKELAGDAKDRVSTYVVDITNKENVEKLPEQILQNHANIDGLINDAGIIQPFVKINDLDYDAINRVMNVNFYGMLYMTKTFLPYLLKRDEAHVINVSSMGGFLPVPGQSLYGASKAAVKLLTEGLYAELKNTNVRVSVVFPGATATNIAKNSGVDTSKIEAATTDAQQKIKALSADKAAEIIVNDIEKNRLYIYVGSDSRIMGLLYRIAPKFATDLITKQMQALLPD